MARYVPAFWVTRACQLAVERPIHRATATDDPAGDRVAEPDAITDEHAETDALTHGDGAAGVQ